MAALKEHRAPLADVPEVYKVHRKNRPILISETEMGTNDRICLTVGLLWLATERQHTGKTLSKHSPALVLPSLCLCFPVLMDTCCLYGKDSWKCPSGLVWWGGRARTGGVVPLQKAKWRKQAANTTLYALAPLLPQTETFKSPCGQ